MNHDEREPINYHRIIQLQFNYVHLHQLTTTYDETKREPPESIDRSPRFFSHSTCVRGIKPSHQHDRAAYHYHQNPLKPCTKSCRCPASKNRRGKVPRSRRDEGRPGTSVENCGKPWTLRSSIEAITCTPLSARACTRCRETLFQRWRATRKRRTGVECRRSRALDDSPPSKRSSIRTTARRRKGRGSGARSPWWADWWGSWNWGNGNSFLTKSLRWVISFYLFLVF